ncbi:hypothetical protein BS17DRAFT_476338, partial [Gyrodon lividus]
MLGRGELLGKFSIGVHDLVERSNTSRPILFSPKQREVVSSCSSLEVTVEPLSPQDANVVLLCSPISAESDEARAVAQATDIGHALMLRYYQDADESRADRAITQFQRVLDRCPPNHPARGAACSNLAMAKFISCQARGAYLDLDVPISLYQDALELRPRDHPDHPSTRLKLAIALLSRFSKWGYSADAEEAKEHLASVQDTCPPESFEHKSAVLVVQTFAMHTRAGEVVERDARSSNWRLPYSLEQLLHALKQCEQRDDPQLLDDVISQHRNALSLYVADQPEWPTLKNNLAVALIMRFERQGQKQDL